MDDQETRAALDRHWAASDIDDFEGEHEIYHEDAVLEYPQSRERIRGRRSIQLSRAAQPNKKHFAVRRITGGAGLWITELVLTYDERPVHTVSIMELVDGKVARETQYFCESFEPGPSRAQWVEQMPKVWAQDSLRQPEDDGSSDANCREEGIGRSPTNHTEPSRVKGPEPRPCEICRPRCGRVPPEAARRLRANPSRSSGRHRISDAVVPGFGGEQSGGSTAPIRRDVTMGS
jgi:hypothetical protein